VKHTLSHSVSRLALVGMAIGALVGSGGTVLCIGSDSHVALESLFAGCCADEHVAGELGERVSAADGCAGCVDLLIEQPLSESSGVRLLAPAGDDGGPHTASEPRSCPQTPLRRVETEGAWPPHLFPLTTVRLLI